MATFPIRSTEESASRQSQSRMRRWSPPPLARGGQRFLQSWPAHEDADDGKRTARGQNQAAQVSAAVGRSPVRTYHRPPTRVIRKKTKLPH